MSPYLSLSFLIYLSVPPVSLCVPLLSLSFLISLCIHYVSLTAHTSPCPPIYLFPPLYFSFSPLIYLSVPYVSLCHPIYLTGRSHRSLYNTPIAPSENLPVLFLKSSSSKISLILPKYLRFSSKISLDSY